jgi:hypothetical protein
LCEVFEKIFKKDAMRLDTAQQVVKSLLSESDESGRASSESHLFAVETTDERSEEHLAVCEALPLDGARRPADPVVAVRLLRSTHPANASQAETLMHSWWQDLLISLAGAVVGWFARHFTTPPENR